MKRKLHGILALLSFLFIASFWSSTVIVELFFGASAIANVKQLIAYALFAFVPIMMAASISGFVLARDSRHPLILKKKRRMPFIALNGFVILVPAAIWLHVCAQTGHLDNQFYAVQILELIAGATNLLLLGLSMRDGLMLGSLNAGIGCREKMADTVAIR